jgi:hypothetical protein
MSTQTERLTPGSSAVDFGLELMKPESLAGPTSYCALSVIPATFSAITPGAIRPARATCPALNLPTTAHPPLPTRQGLLTVHMPRPPQLASAEPTATSGPTEWAQQPRAILGRAAPSPQRRRRLQPRSRGLGSSLPPPLCGKERWPPEIRLDSVMPCRILPGLSRYRQEARSCA